GELISVVGYWVQSSVNGPARFELKETDITKGPSTMISRIVANGRDLFIYNPIQNSYSVTPYGGSPDRLFAALRNGVDVPESIVSRLLAQVYGGDRPTFQRWLPGAYGQCDGNSVEYIRGDVANSGQGLATITFGLLPFREITGVEQGPVSLNRSSIKWTL